MAGDDLITDAPALTPGAAGLLVAALVASAAALVGTALNDRLRPPERVQLVGREAAEEAATAHDRDLWDGSWARWVDTRLRTRSRTRREVGPYWAGLLFLAGDVKGRNLVVGKDGWLFLRRRVELAPWVLEEGPVAAANVLAALRARLAGGGVELVVAPLPRKAVACAEQLPDGVDPLARFDRAVLDALLARGLTTIDLLDEWTAAPPAEVYMKFDTHWSRGGMLGLVKGLAAAAPGLRHDVAGAWLEPAETRAWQDLLDVVGLNHHPVASRWFDGRLQENRRIGPPAARARLRPEGVYGELVVSGTSFTAAAMFGELCGGLLGAPTTVLSQRGLPPLSAFPEVLPRLGPMPPGTTLLVEFPTVLVDSFGGRSVVLDRALASLFRAYPPERTVPLDPARLRPPVPLPDPGVGRARLRFHEHALLSQGRGSLLLRIEVDPGARGRTAWELRTTGGRLPFELAPGEHVVLPVVDGARASRTVNLCPMNAPAVTAPVTVTVVREAGTERAVEVAPAGAGHRLELSARPGPRDTLELRWEGERGPLEVELVGTGPGGVPRRETVSFSGTNARVAVLSTEGFVGGDLGHAVVRGGVGAPAATYVSVGGRD